MIYLGKNAVGISDTVQVVPEDIVNRVNAVEIKETVSTPSNIVTIYDGADNVPVDELVVGIEPLQDLHGYENPWPSGGGKNLLDESTIEICAYTDNGQKNNIGNDVYRSINIDLPAGTYTISTSLENPYLIRYIVDNSRVIVPNVFPFTFTISDSVNVKFSFRKTDSTNITSAFTTQIESGSTATAYVPYSNICPISGWTGCNVTQTGKNLVSQSGFVIGIVGTNGSKTAANGSISDKTKVGEVTVTTTSGWTGVMTENPIQVVPGQAYTASCDTTSGVAYVILAYYDANGTFIANSRSLSAGNTHTSVAPDDAAGVKVSYQWSAAGTYTIKGIQFETGSTVSSYEEFVPSDTYSITFPTEAGTVYGGTLTIHKDGTGTLIVDKEFMEFDETANILETSEVGNTGRYFMIPVGPVGYVEKGNIISNQYVATTISVSTRNTGISISSSTAYSRSQVVIRPNDYVNVELSAFKQSLANNHLQVVFGLAEPVPYELTALEIIKTLKGTNNIWANTGAIQFLTYSADPKMYVDQNKGVSDVQVNGTSVVTNGVANVPIANSNVPGVIYVSSFYGHTTNNGRLTHKPAGTETIKAGTDSADPIVSKNAFEASFYGLAKAAGDSTQSASSNAVGNYTETAKSKISDMLSAPVTVSGITPSITALPGVRYICGECSTLSITVPESGIIDVTFTSGSTATVLTVTPPTGMTMKWANGFDPASLDANMVYEINILDGCYGVVGTWT